MPRRSRARRVSRRREASLPSGMRRTRCGARAGSRRRSRDVAKRQSIIERKARRRMLKGWSRGARGTPLAMLAVARRPFREQPPGDAQGSQDRLVLGQAGLLGGTTGHDLLRQRSGSRTLEPGHLQIGADPRSGGRPNRAVGLLGRDADGERCAHRPASSRSRPSRVVQSIEPCLRDRLAILGRESNAARPGCHRAAHRTSPGSRR